MDAKKKIVFKILGIPFFSKTEFIISEIKKEDLKKEIMTEIFTELKKVR